MMLDEPFAGSIRSPCMTFSRSSPNLRTRKIGVLISDHNVEQTLDIVDRAYIMFDGEVKVAGTVRDLVFDDTVADIYLGPTLTARLRARFASNAPVPWSRRHEDRAVTRRTQLKQELKINPRLYQAMDLLYMPLLDLQQHLKQELLNNPFLEMVEPEEDEEEAGEETEAEAVRGTDREAGKRRDRLGGDPPRRLRRGRPPRGARGARVLRAGHGRFARSVGPPARPDHAARSLAAPGGAGRGIHRQHRRGRLPQVRRSRRSSPASTTW